MEFKKTTKDSGSRQQKNRPPHQGNPSNAPASELPRSAARTVHININFHALPKISLPSKTSVASFTQRLLRAKKPVIITSAVIVAIASFLVIGQVTKQHNLAKVSGSTSDSTKIVENLEYQTVLPDNKSISDLGGWERVSPPGSDPVFAYSDKIGAVAVTVSQQPLPKAFKDHADDQVADLAKKFNATTKIDASGTKVYIGTSAKGPQSVIFTKNGLLILIKSQAKIDDATWAKYAKSLN